MDFNDMESASYCVPGASEFQRAYGRIHGYVALSICVLGSAANTINIAVLSRREMTSATNSILTGLAVADLLVMLEYIPFALHIYISIGPQINSNTYAWAVFVYFHSIFSQTFHTISIWLTVTLAVWRYISIAYPQHNRTFAEKKNTTMAIACAYFVSPFLCLPIYFAMKIVPLEMNAPISNDTASETTPGGTSYGVQMGDNDILVGAIFWVYSVLFKLIPCIALSILSSCLISQLATTERRRRNLMKKKEQHNMTDESEKAKLNATTGGCQGKSSRASSTDRTTRMLLAVLGLFLVTEFPQGLFGLLSAVAPHFFETCYGLFGDLMDVLALMSSAVNFVLYCSMSRQFRSTFARLARAAFSTALTCARESDEDPAKRHKIDRTQVTAIL